MKQPTFQPIRTQCGAWLFAILLAACGGGGGGGSSTTPAPNPTPPAPTPTATIEQNLGEVLQRPVFQCGSSTDTLTADQAPGSVSVFESGPVRPLVLSADGRRLYVANAPANCLEIYAVEGDSLRLASSVAVGLEPVAIAERNANEVWVVNHLSDSVSVVRLDGTPRVLRTLQVGDEPRDIVFAGPNRDRAFITAAFRGQNRPGMTFAAQITSGSGRADVWVFDAAALDDSLNGKPMTILTLFADTPRALAVTPDGATVYAAAFMSGNRTTTLHRDALGNAKPGISRSTDNVAQPGTGLIVKFDGTAWRDEAGTDWSAKVKFSLPDFDVFAIDANAATPRLTSQIAGVGTTLFNMAVHPSNGNLMVSNSDAINQVRFEGSGTRASTVRGRIAESRISVVNPQNGAVEAVHLNPHVDFAASVPLTAAEKAKSLSQPTSMAFNAAGDTLYAAAFGSAKVAALPVADLTRARFAPNAARHIDVPAGPSGLALNSAGTRLYVYSRIAHRIAIADTATRNVINTVPMFSPESSRTISGRNVLYDANLSSSNGTVACAACHIFGDMDHLAWDLGNPDGATIANNNAYVPNNPKTTLRFHPLKGPMTTQTLRGMAGNGPLHWRGDRSGSARAQVRGQTESLEDAAFKEFNPAFVDLLGRAAPLSSDDMQSFTDFAMTLAMPPNPNRPLNGILDSEQEAGRSIYFNQAFITLLGSCNSCHAMDPAQRKFGTGGLMAFEGGRISENFKVPHLRNVYQKLGMFGFSAGGGAATGPQVRGFGFAHDGSVDTLETFFSDPVFIFPAPASLTRSQVAAFVAAADTDLAPVVGQQVTWRPGSSAEQESRLNLLKQQAAVVSPRAVCDLVVRGAVDGVASSGLLQTDGQWRMKSGTTLSDTALRALATINQPLTFTCVPPGSGRRIALNAG
jgi:DNA-binding beta-propeller fold protein YncE